MRTGNQNFYDKRAKDAFVFLIIILLVIILRIFIL